MSETLIIGGTGKIGSAAVEHLHNEGADFVALIRNPEKMSRLRKEGIPCVKGNYTDLSSINKALEGISKMLLLVSPHIDMAAQEKLIINAAKDQGIGFIVNISVIGSQEDKTTHLAQQHAESERYLKDSGISHTILQPHSFMQNILGNLPTIKEHGAMYGTIGDAAVPLIDARDIGEAAARILINPIPHIGKSYTLTGPEKITFSEAASIIGEVSGISVNYVNVPDTAAKSAMVNAGLPEWLVDDLLTLNNRWKNGAETEVTSDLEMILGHTPRTFRDFVSDHRFLFS